MLVWLSHSGLVVRIRRVDQVALVAIAPLLLMNIAREPTTVVQPPPKSQGATAPAEPEGPRAGEISQQVVAILAQAMVEPHLWTGLAADCPPDAITIEDLGPDVWAVVAAVMEYEGLTTRHAEAAGEFARTYGVVLDRVARRYGVTPIDILRLRPFERSLLLSVALVGATADQDAYEEARREQLTGSMDQAHAERRPITQ